VLSEATVRGVKCSSTETHHSDSEPTSLCSFSLILRAWRRSNKYQFHGLGLTRSGLGPTIYHTHKHNTTDVVRCVTHGWLRYDYSHDITEILLKVALNTRTHNHSSHYSLLITRGSPFMEIIVSLQKKAIYCVHGGEATNTNFMVLAWPDRGSDQRSTTLTSITPLTWWEHPITNICTWPRGNQGFTVHFVIAVLFMSMCLSGATFHTRTVASLS
jgi:hypothetical protein